MQRRVFDEQFWKPFGPTLPYITVGRKYFVRFEGVQTPLIISANCRTFDQLCIR